MADCVCGNPGGAIVNGRCRDCRLDEAESRCVTGADFPAEARKVLTPEEWAELNNEG